MDEERFDAIIVGGGLAGLTAAYVLAQEGLAVVLVERGNTCGSKNVTGGKLCTHSIEKVFPDFAEIAPVERKIVREKITTWDGDDNGIDPEAYGLTHSEGYSVVRPKLDSWLAQQCDEAGVMIIQGIVVNDLIVRDGRVCGIVADEDELEANVVILAEGINGLLAQKLGMIPELSADEVCVGVKEVIELGEATINDRFALAAGEGIEWMFMGDRSKGQYADGFLYTNKNTVSLGVEFLISDVQYADKSVPEMLDELKAQPHVAALLNGGKLVEYAGHLVKKSKSAAIGKLYADGVLLAGDTAGLVANFGWVVRGMDMAVESGRLAAEAVIQATEAGDFSAETLASYQQAVEASFIAKDMQACADYLNK